MAADDIDKIVNENNDEIERYDVIEKVRHTLHIFSRKIKHIWNHQITIYILALLTLIAFILGFYSFSLFNGDDIVEQSASFSVAEEENLELKPVELGDGISFIKPSGRRLVFFSDDLKLPPIGVCNKLSDVSDLSENNDEYISRCRRDHSEVEELISAADPDISACKYHDAEGMECDSYILYDAPYENFCFLNNMFGKYCESQMVSQHVRLSADGSICDKFTDKKIKVICENVLIVWKSYVTSDEELCGDNVDDCNDGDPCFCDDIEEEMIALIKLDKELCPESVKDSCELGIDKWNAILGIADAKDLSMYDQNYVKYSKQMREIFYGALENNMEPDCSSLTDFWSGVCEERKKNFWAFKEMDQTKCSKDNDFYETCKNMVDLLIAVDSGSCEGLTTPEFKTACGVFFDVISIGDIKDCVKVHSNVYPHLQKRCEELLS